MSRPTCLVPTLRPSRDAVLLRPRAAAEQLESELTFLGAAMQVCGCRACSMARHPSAGG